MSPAVIALAVSLCWLTAATLIFSLCIVAGRADRALGCSTESKDLSPVTVS